jgi:hypothetical protein
LYLDELDFTSESEPEAPEVTPTPTTIPINNNTGSLVIHEGRAVAELGSNQSMITVSLEQIGDRSLEVKSGDAIFTISPAVIRALKQRAGITDGANLEVQLSPLTDLATNAPVVEGKAQVAVAGQVYELSIILKQLDGSTYRAEQVSGGVEITLPYTSGFDSELLGVYYFNEITKQWEYIGGTVDRVTNTVKVKLQHLHSKYAVLEYKKSFDDVPATHWASRILQVLSARHIVNGVSDNLFQPTGDTTRAEFVALLVRALNLEAVEEVKEFKDVRSDAWYAGSVQAAVKSGIVSGISADLFAPDAQITRVEMAVLIARALRLKTDSSASEEFADAKDIPVWALSYVTALKKADLIQGRGQNQFKPLATATRAEAAKLILDVMNNMK